MAFLPNPYFDFLSMHPKYKYSKILFSGINGPLGAALIEQVKNDERFRGFSSQECNLLDLNSVRRFFKDQIASHNPSEFAYVHLAAKSGGIAFSKSYPATTFVDNLEMSMNVAKACQELGVKRILFTLSISCYSDSLESPEESQIHDGPVKSEDYGYAYAKRMQEVLMRTFNDQYGMQISSVLVNGIVGKRMSFAPGNSILPASLIREFHKMKESKEAIDVVYDPRARREYTNSRDLSAAVIWCLHNQDENTLLNIGNTQPYSVKDVATLIASRMGIDTKRLNFIERNGAGRLQQSSSNRHFINSSGFKYRPLSEAIDDAVSWYLDEELSQT